MVAATKKRANAKKPAKKTGVAAMETITDPPVNGHESGKPKRGEMSGAIRTYWLANQNAKPKQILEALAAQGKTVAIGLINSVIAAEKKKLGLTSKKSKGSKATKGPGRPAKAVASSSTDSVGAITAAQGLIEATGGVDEAILFLSALKKILG